MEDRRPPKGYETHAHLRDKGPRGQSAEQFHRELAESEKMDKPIKEHEKRREILHKMADKIEAGIGKLKNANEALKEHQQSHWKEK